MELIQCSHSCLIYAAWRLLPIRVVRIKISGSSSVEQQTFYSPGQIVCPEGRFFASTPKGTVTTSRLFLCACDIGRATVSITRAWGPCSPSPFYACMCVGWRSNHHSKLAPTSTCTCSAIQFSAPLTKNVNLQIPNMEPVM